MTTRLPLLAGNWKMHSTPSEAAALARQLKVLLGPLRERQVLIVPPFPAIPSVVRELHGSGIEVGAQNLHWEDQGAFTGEVSAPMLTDAGCSHVIVGHSERRQYFGETDEWVQRKVSAALRHKLTPIVCVGETAAQRKRDETLSIVASQVRGGFRNLPSEEFCRVILAYEPVWAIGTGNVATPEDAQVVHRALRQLLDSLAPQGVADTVRILYGGSVKPDNIDALMEQPDIDGALVGGASLKASDFTRIVHYRS
jgi:triosephosphate isomerase (TIM)